MGAIKTDTGAALADSMRDARELTGAMVRLCKGEPVERAVTGLTTALVMVAARSGMTESEFVTYTRQQFALFARGVPA
jgi:hypothetical protein